ncbi:MAG: isopenicillin N synthase family oxygenase [Gammaproteobacteria bacterium]|nr:isopenicillin N synthase family oxygenase [Gammaproteobacteria bacterium]
MMAERVANRLPIVDLGGEHASKAARLAAAAALDKAYRELGFCYVSNTGVDPALVAATFEASRRFHAMPDEAKHALAINAWHRGYIAPASSTIRSSSVAEVKRANLSDSFMVMHEVSPDDPRYGQPLQGPNQWPTQLPGFKPTVEAYRSAMTALALRLTRILALGLGLDEQHLDPYFEQPTVWLRLLHYPPQPAAAADDQYGAAPHTDYGFITILAQDGVGGLEVRTRSGEWLAAPPMADTFVVNVADMLARWSNDRWTSTPHRVRNRSPRDRFSIPFFWDTSMDSRIECLPSCRVPGETPRYEPVVFGDYVLDRLNRNYAYRHAGGVEDPGTGLGRE